MTRRGRPCGRPRLGARPGQCPNRPAFWPAQTEPKAGHQPEPTGLQAGQAGVQAGVLCRRGTGVVNDGEEGKEGRGENYQDAELTLRQWRGHRGEGVAGGDEFGRRSSAGCGRCRGRERRVRTSRPDSAGGEEAEDAADLPVRFNQPCTHWYDGGELDPHGGKEELGKGKKNRSIRNSWKERGERGERGQVHDGLAFLDPQGPRHGAAKAGRSAWTPATVATVR